MDVVIYIRMLLNLLFQGLNFISIWSLFNCQNAFWPKILQSEWLVIYWRASLKDLSQFILCIDMNLIYLHVLCDCECNCVVKLFLNYMLHFVSEGMLEALHRLRGKYIIFGKKKNPDKTHIKSFYVSCISDMCIFRFNL